MNTKCLICNSSADFLFPKIDWSETFYFYKCSACQHVFVFPLPSKEDLDSFYNKDYYVPNFQRIKVRNKGAFIAKFINISKTPMLEIGCSYGHFLEYMKEKDVNVEGLELSQKASQNAIEKGFSVKCGSIESITLDKVYKSIFLFDVLEHIPNPHEFLKLVGEKLQVNGEMFLTVPNQNSLEFRYFKKYWEWSSPPAHLHFFNIKSITKLLNQNGFKVEIATSFKGDSAGNIFFHLYDCSKRFILFNLGLFFFGKTKFLEKKKKYNLQQKDIRQFNTKEFSGLTLCVFNITNIFNFADRVLRNKFNEPTLFIKTTKNESR